MKKFGFFVFLVALMVLAMGSSAFAQIAVAGSDADSSSTSGAAAGSFLSLEQFSTSPDTLKTQLQLVPTPVPGLMNNFGPNTNYWNNVEWGIKRTFARKEAEAMLNVGEKGKLKAYVGDYKKGKAKTDEIMVVWIKDVEAYNKFKKSADPAKELGVVVAKGKVDKNTTIQTRGLALLNAMDMGGDVYFVVDNDIQIENLAKALNLGLVIGNAGMSGAYAGNANGGVGYTTGNVGAKAQPFIQGYVYEKAAAEGTQKPADAAQPKTPEAKFNTGTPAKQSVLGK